MEAISKSLEYGNFEPLGHCLYDARIKAGIGLKQFALEMGIDPEELRKIELGEAEPVQWLYNLMWARLGSAFRATGLKDNSEF